MLAIPLLNLLQSISLCSYCNLIHNKHSANLDAVSCWRTHQIFTSVFLSFMGVLITQILFDFLCYRLNFHMAPHSACSLFSNHLFTVQDGSHPIVKHRHVLSLTNDNISPKKCPSVSPLFYRCLISFFRCV